MRTGFLLTFIVLLFSYKGCKMVFTVLFGIVLFFQI